ncbi:nucleolar complex protein 4 homolog isoform X2 [Arctopsyche grandis]
MRQTAFKLSWQVVIGNILRGGIDSRLQALTTACNLLKIQAELLSTKKFDKFYFPSHMLQGIILQLLSDKSDNSQIIQHFQKYTDHNDILFYSWKILTTIPHPTPVNNVYINNYLDLVNILPLQNDRKRKLDEEDNKPKIFCETLGSRRFRFDIKCVHQWMEESWNFISSQKLHGAVLQKALLVLHDTLLPHLPRPVLLTDFLMTSMDAGGAVSVLALQGVFTLMQKHNLEYPLVYNKLYIMYEPEMFFTKHKSRLFYLTDIFLGSTHLPEVLVAGFLKKFSRLALVVPSSDAIILLHMIANLVIRHPGLKKMLDYGKSSETQLKEDPYNIDTTDPSLSGAISSSLWEVADLRQHIHPAVASAATYAFNAHHNKLEKPISEFLDDTMDTLIEAEFKRKYKQVFLTTKPPTSMKDSSDDRIMQFWQI